MKTHRKYLLGLLALVIVAVLGTIGGIAFATGVGGSQISNALTLTGNSEPLPVHNVTLAWTSVAGGTISGDGASVTWVVGTPYLVDILQTNAGDLETGVYAKITGLDFAQFTVVYISGGVDYDLGADVSGPKLLGFLDGGAYYFGPKGGDTLDPAEVQTFNLRVTPLAAVTGINVSIVDVIEVTDPRP